MKKSRIITYAFIFTFIMGIFLVASVPLEDGGEAKTNDDTVFDWPKQENIIFDEDSSDAQILYIPSSESPYKLIYTDGSNDVKLYESEVLGRNRSRWSLVSNDLGFDGEADTIIYTNRTFYAYSDDRVFTAQSLNGNWTLRNADLPGPDDGDGGGFYAPETGKFYYYPESESQNTIEVYASNNGVDSWNYQGDVVCVNDGFPKIGDAEVVQVGDLYYMFIDNATSYEPLRYNISMYYSDNLTSGWRRYGRAINHLPGEAIVQDPDVIFDPRTDQMVMFANRRITTSDAPHISYYEANTSIYGQGRDINQIRFESGPIENRSNSCSDE